MAGLHVMHPELKEHKITLKSLKYFKTFYKNKTMVMTYSQRILAKAFVRRKFAYWEDREIGIISITKLGEEVYKKLVELEIIEG